MFTLPFLSIFIQFFVLKILGDDRDEKWFPYLHIDSREIGFGYEASINSRTLSSVASDDLLLGSVETKKKNKNDYVKKALQSKVNTSSYQNRTVNYNTVLVYKSIFFVKLIM